MTKVLSGLAGLWLVCATASANGPEGPVGPVKPVVVVNDALNVTGTVKAVVDQPVQVEGEVTIGNPVSVDVLTLPSAPDAERFQVVLDIEVLPDSGFESRRLNIPPGKRMLIDYVTATVQTLDTQRAYLQILAGPVDTSIFDTGLSLASAPHVFPLHDTGSRVSTGPTYRVWLLSQPTVLWADSFAAVLLARGPSLDGPFPDRGGPAGGRITVSGRLVDLPAAP